MKIASLNTWKNEGRYQSRLDAMIIELRRLDPDVVLLQECFRCEETEDDTTATIAQALGMRFSYAPARRKLRCHEGALRRSESGLAVLSRCPMVDSWMMDLPSTEKGGERVAVFAQLSTESGLLGCVCVHFSHVRDEQIVRQEQIECVLRSVGRALLNGPVVVGGDFNCPPESEEVRKAVGAFGGRFVNALPSLGIADFTSPNPSKLDQIGRQIDQIWLLDSVGDSQLRLLAGGVVSSECGPEGDPIVSDHALVWAHVERSLATLGT